MIRATPGADRCVDYRRRTGTRSDGRVFWPDNGPGRLHAMPEPAAPNHLLQRLLRERGDQGMTRVSQRNDAQEQEATRFADRTVADLGRLDTPGRWETGETSLHRGPRVLAGRVRRFFEQRLGAQLPQLRMHTDGEASRSAAALNARAYTVGGNIVFGSGEFRPGTPGGLRLLAHELIHVLQQRSGAARGVVQRDIEVRSPVLEETVTQISTVEAGVHGRPLTRGEIALARPVYGRSLDYGRVRLIPTRVLVWRTVGNTIRIPTDFDLQNADHAQILIHELAHVWQYQHAGTSYISVSLADQISGYIRTGSRGAAYEYTITPDRTFFDYRPEQQASIVERYFQLSRERANPRISSERRSAIDREIAEHQPLIDQMRRALPTPEIDLLNQRARDLMTTPGAFQVEPVSPEREMVPLRPIFELRF